MSLSKNTKPRHRAGLFHLAAMRSTALPSYQYADPMRVLEQKQAAEANAEKRGKRPTLHCKSGWSEARKRAEALFDFAPAGALPSSPGTPSNSARAGGSGKDLT
ncbi:hypothetical protein [Paraburkholderia tropica]|uniref:hypothetical protein n=1 Tax=Paraburkholderia tropica TaxID=92647 RepID=UPI0012EA1963|nr:hypothetical protein [Paraburkholderia tropica]